MEARLFTTPPEWTTPEWYETRERAPHLEQPGHHGRLHLARSYVEQVAHQIATVSDLGAGDGGFLSTLTHLPLRCWGYDLQPSNIAGAAERGVDVRLVDFTAGPVDYGDLAVATEVLEHLVDPHGFLRQVPSRYLVASSPAFETAESHYPFHTWAWDLDGYRNLVGQAGYTVTAQQVTGDFQVLLAVRE